MRRAVSHIVQADIGLASGGGITVIGERVLDDIGPGFTLAGIVLAEGQAAVVFVDLPDIDPGVQPRTLQRGEQDLEPAVCVKIGDGGKPGLILKIGLPDAPASLDQRALLRFGHGRRRGCRGGCRRRSRGIDVRRGCRHRRRRRCRHSLRRFRGAGAQEQHAQKQRRGQFEKGMFHCNPPVIQYDDLTLCFQKKFRESSAAARNRSSFGFGVMPFGPQRASRTPAAPDIYLIILYFIILYHISSFSTSENGKSSPKTGSGYELQGLITA